MPPRIDPLVPLSLAACVWIAAPACAMQVGDGEHGDGADLEEAEAVGANLLANPGFEDPVQDSRCIAGEWWECPRTGNWGLHSAGAVRMTSAHRPHATGPRSLWGLHLADSDVEGYEWATQEFATQVVPVRAGQRYRFRAYARPTGDDAPIGHVFVRFPVGPAGDRRWLDLLGQPDFDFDEEVREGGWHFFWYEGTAPPGATRAQITLYGGGEVGTDWDDVVFAPVQ